MQTLHVDSLVGRTLGEYQVERLLGHSRSGAAYLARHLSQGRTVMITAFNFPQGLTTQERNRLTSQFAQERAALVRLTHPTILPIYDFGEQVGYLYLVTAFVKGASLGQVLKQQGRFSPEQTLGVLKQVAAGLDYAHSQGVVHGILSLATVLLSNEFTMQLAGFGLRTLLEVQGNRQNTPPEAFLFSTSGTLLGSPAYTSPERVMGKPIDARSDIYALGVMLFELLSGTLPFRGANPLETALQRIQQPVPSLHAVRPDVPEAFDLVLGKALERDPARRYQRAGESAADFERLFTTLDATHRGGDPRIQQVAHSPQFTLPPTVNWFDEAGISPGKWQLVPPIVTERLPAVTPSPPFQHTSRDEGESGPVKLPGAATDRLPTKAAHPAPAGENPNSMAGVDPFAWWSATSAKPTTEPRTPGTFTKRPPMHLAKPNPRSRRRPAQQDRRKLVTLIAAGTGGVLVGGISFAHLVQSLKQPQSQVATMPTAGSTAPPTTQGNTPTVGTTTGTQKTPVSSMSPTATPSPAATQGAQPSPTAQPTQQPTPKPTQPPAPTPTPPSHTGTVIGHTTMAHNSSVSFTNPADGQGSVLIRLSNGNFVACEQACTHAGVAVNYNSGSGQLVCPAHGANFNPASGFSQVPGTGPSGLKPLPQVTIRVNADGTITTG